MKQYSSADRLTTMLPNAINLYYSRMAVADPEGFRVSTETPF